MLRDFPDILEFACVFVDCSGDVVKLVHHGMPLNYVEWPVRRPSGRRWSLRHRL